MTISSVCVPHPSVLPPSSFFSSTSLLPPFPLLPPTLHIPHTRPYPDPEAPPATNATKKNKQSRQAYESGDGAGAKELSNAGKAHGARMAEYNRQASEHIFRENNAPGRVGPDAVDLHGQFVEEAEDILEARIRRARAEGQTHLRV